ncbi:MAG: metal-dependent transcriptional regulator [Bacteroidetes bacterium]|nr:metal-dependent transcriptional regulator [Bacteroidota bacterium]
MQTISREDYLKAILKIEEESGTVSNQALVEKLSTRPASVTNMLHTLADAGWVEHLAYKGVHLTQTGKAIALSTLRKHRLWEVFLVEKLNFNWDEVHQWAEDLEHVGDEELTNRLDAFLDHPAFDPHGDPIPTAQGQWSDGRNLLPASQADVGDRIQLKGVVNSGEAFLQHLNRLGIKLGLTLEVLQALEFDGSKTLKWPDGTEASLSKQTLQNMLIERVEIKSNKR